MIFCGIPATFEKNLLHQPNSLIAYHGQIFATHFTAISDSDVL